MLKKNPKTRCERKQYTKCEGVCRTYNKIQAAYAALLEGNPEVETFQCNVPLDGLDEGEYTSDFVAKKTDGSYRVRECVERKKLLWPSVTKLLDASRNYWTKRGVEDWGLVIDKEKSGDED